MSSKPSDNNDERYKTLGFESCFDGSTGGIQWSELIEDLKTNVLRQDLRVRKFIMGEYAMTVKKRLFQLMPVPARRTRRRSSALKSKSNHDLPNR